MREISRNVHIAFTYLDTRDARETSKKQGTDDLIKLGAIDESPEAFRKSLEDQFEALVRQHRESKRRRGETHLQQINLWKINEDGEKDWYYKACGELTTPEAVQHLRYWDKKIAEDQDQRQHYYQFHKKRHGKKLDKMLGFMDHPAEAG